jgi:hypothetical protein
MYLSLLYLYIINILLNDISSDILVVNSKDVDVNDPVLNSIIQKKNYENIIKGIYFLFNFLLFLLLFI